MILRDVKSSAPQYRMEFDVLVQKTQRFLRALLIDIRPFGPIQSGGHILWLGYKRRLKTRSVAFDVGML